MTKSIPESATITTAILAGGAASRLGGSDKGLVDLCGRPLVAWTIDALQLAPGQACLIVANRNIAAYKRFAPTISDAHKETFAGPLAGVAAALATGQVPRVGRNEPCPCGSGKKYKQCHGKLI